MRLAYHFIRLRQAKAAVFVIHTHRPGGFTRRTSRDGSDAESGVLKLPTNPSDQRSPCLSEQLCERLENVTHG